MDGGYGFAWAWKAYQGEEADVDAGGRQERAAHGEHAQRHVVEAGGPGVDLVEEGVVLRLERGAEPP